MKFTIGTLVLLKPKAIKDFYGEKDRPLDFVKGYANWDNMCSEAFVDFVGTWLGFESGEGVGMVYGIGASEDDIKIYYENFVTGEMEYSYYSSKDLKKQQ